MSAPVFPECCFFAGAAAGAQFPGADSWPFPAVVVFALQASEFAFRGGLDEVGDGGVSLEVPDGVDGGRFPGCGLLCFPGGLQLLSECGQLLLRAARCSSRRARSLAWASAAASFSALALSRSATSWSLSLRSCAQAASMAAWRSLARVMPQPSRRRRAARPAPAAPTVWRRPARGGQRKESYAKLQHLSGTGKPASRYAERGSGGGLSCCHR